VTLILSALVNKQENVFSKAFLVLVLISYKQAFADGNKRTSRIVSSYDKSAFNL
jgi:prophage maintenance system killer protein